MKIFDTFTFFNELDILELRLNILNDYVDQFILVEATKSHQNNPKPLYFKDNIERFEKFLPKIKHIVVDNFPQYSYWSHENHQRDAIYQSLKEVANDNDIVFISDLDEIWNPKKLFPLLNTIQLDRIYRWRSRICYFYFNLIADQQDWVQPMFLNFSLLKNLIEKNNLKLSYDIFHNQSLKLSSNMVIPIDFYSGWHFSFTQSPIYKLQNYLHPEFRHLTEEDFNEFIKNKINPFYKNKMEVIPVEDFNTYLPEFVLNNMGKYDKYLLK